MSYLRLTVYSFTCDNPGGCGSPRGGEYESLPPYGTGLRGAEKELRAEGWTVRDGKHYCPDHKPQEG
jgi:hypothetical protein